MGSWSILSSRLDLRLVAITCVVAALGGAVAGTGNALLVAVLIVGIVGAVAVVTRPVAGVIGSLLLLPFMFYPVTIEGFSLFIGVPIIALVVGTIFYMPGRLPARSDLPVVSAGIFGLLALMSAIASVNPLLSASRVLYFGLFCAFAGAVSILLRKGLLSRKQLTTTLVGSGAVAACAVILQFSAQLVIGVNATLDALVGIYPIFGGARAAGLETNHNWYVPSLAAVRGIFPFMAAPSAGQYLMVCLLIAVWSRQDLHIGRIRVPNALFISVISVALLLTFSRQAWVGAIVGLVVLATTNRRPRVLLALATVGLVGFFATAPSAAQSLGQLFLSAADTSSQSSGERLEVLQETFAILGDRWFSLGVGPGLFSTLAGVNVLYYAHNLVLDTAVETGLLGLAAFVALIGRILHIAIRTHSYVLPCLVAVLVANLFDDVFYFPRNGFLVATLVGIAGAQPRSAVGHSETST